ncbi:MAG: UvrD-helicase domain-containing protein [Candidatus Sabulitectum sp.]|nr:UvrD-helicase domain-containing protein [Candidatus Sabulitectum sp.]
MPQKTDITLNKDQQEAVQYNSGHLLVLAGAGSGKTRVLTAKIARIIDTGLAKPWQILAMTFTNKAAGEMRERIYKQLNDDTIRLRMGTFHSICAWILRREARALGFPENFSIYDGDDQKTLIRRILKTAELPMKITPGAIKGYISNSKNDLITVEEALSSASTPYQESLAIVYRDYDKELQKCGAFDFDDLLTQVLIALRQNSDTGKHYKNMFTRILVDEYQDTNRVQNEILKEFTGENTVVTVVGDDDQSIYGWRGARVENILQFPQEYPDAKTVRLETNYRSTGNILHAASSLVKHNRSRHGKTLRPILGPGEKVQVRQTVTPDDEAHFILSTARDLNSDGTPWNEIAVLFRTNAQSRPLETMCRRMRIPYEVVGTIRFFERAEIKDIVSYLRVIVNPADAGSFRRVLNKPTRGVGAKGQLNFFHWSDQNGTDVVTTLEKSGSVPGIAKRAQTVLETLGRNMRSCMDGVNAGDTASDIVDRVLDFTGLLDLYGTGEVADETRLENIRELRSYAAEYDGRNPEGGLPGFLAEQSLLSSSDSYSGDEKLVLMTLHSAKGLEFDCVFVSGLEEGMLPYIRPQEYSPKDVEEERRLLYVGMTRARKRLFLTWCTNRPRPGSFPIGPSRFLAEVADDESYDTHMPRIPAQKPSAAAVDAPAQSASTYTRGNLVKHPRYGKGVVISAKRRGSEWELKINFGFDEPKTLLTGYVPIPVLKEKAQRSDLE